MMPGVKNASESRGGIQQFVATVILCLLVFSCGIGWGWTSPVTPQLQTKRPPVGDAPVTADQVAWIGSLLPAGAVIIIPFCSFLTERYGRKPMAFTTAVPIIVSWLLIIFTRDLVSLYLARFAIGLANGLMTFVVSLYISEIVSVEFRGFLMSFILLSINTGMLFAYVVGTYLSYGTFAWVCSTFSLVFVATFGFIPETPVYLVRRNLLEQARKSLMFYRGNNKDIVDQELIKLRSQVTTETSFSAAKLMDLFKDRATRNGLIISFGLFAGKQFSGIFPVNSFAETIFLHAGSSISASTASMIIGLIQTVGSSTSTLLIDRVGRRPLALVTCIGMTLSHCLIALYFYLKRTGHDVTSIGWLPVVALSSYMITFCAGYGGVAYVMVSEVFKLDVAGPATNLGFLFFWATSFLAVQEFNLSTKLFGDEGCFFSLACFCVITFVFVYFLIPETRGRDREDIVHELSAGIRYRRRRETGGIDQNDLGMANC